MRRPVTPGAPGASGQSERHAGTPLVDLATIVSLIGQTRSRAGLHVRAELDRGRSPAGVKVTDAHVRLTRHRFHGEWNYTIHPAATAPT